MRWILISILISMIDWQSLLYDLVKWGVEYLKKKKKKMGTECLWDDEMPGYIIQKWNVSLKLHRQCGNDVAIWDMNKIDAINEIL